MTSRKSSTNFKIRQKLLQSATVLQNVTFLTKWDVTFSVNWSHNIFQTSLINCVGWVGYTGLMGKRVCSCVGGVSQIISWIEWIAWVHEILTWVNKFLAGAGNQNLAWVGVVPKFGIGTKFFVGHNVHAWT